VLFRLRTGCQWSRLPWEYPDGATVHRHFQRWVERGVLDRALAKDFPMKQIELCLP
jgi:transposase